MIDICVTPLVPDMTEGESESLIVVALRAMHLSMLIYGEFRMPDNDRFFPEGTA